MKFARNDSPGSKEHKEIVYEPKHEEMVSEHNDESLCIDWTMNHYSNFLSVNHYTVHELMNFVIHFI